MDIIKTIKQLLRRKSNIHILSDSHGEAFKFIDFKQFNLNSSFCIVQGATASGLSNPNSKTKALPIFLNYLNSKIKNNDFILLELGEVDCGFTIWLISENKGIHVKKQALLTLNNYKAFLNQVSSYTSKPLIIVSAILPTIADGQDFGQVANLRKEVKATLIERTNLTLEFNRNLREFCSMNNHVFIDLDQDLFDHETSTINQAFKNDNKLDHHLNPLKLSELLETKLKVLFNEKSA